MTEDELILVDLWDRETGYAPKVSCGRIPAVLTPEKVN